MRGELSPNAAARSSDTLPGDSEPRFVCTGCRAIYRAGYERCPRDGAPLEALGNDPLVGCVLHDRYLIECCIGEGAMGRVYRARHTRVSRRFAIKVLFGDLAADPRMRARFAQEAEVASRLEHPNVVSVVDFGGNDQGLLYLAMDFVEGQNLATLMALEAPFDELRVIRLARDLAKGLAHAHSRGLVHRDFKADNVVVVHDGEREVPRIIDFGVAFLKEAGTSNDRLTATGCVVGTPAYMSPEQAAGLAFDHRTDLFSLGLLMYEMLAGVAPFKGNPIEVARHNATSPLPPISFRAPKVKVSPQLEAVVRRLLEKRADDRYPSAESLLDALSRVRVDSSLKGKGQTLRNTLPTFPPEPEPSAMPTVESTNPPLFKAPTVEASSPPVPKLLPPRAPSPAKNGPPQGRNPTAPIASAAIAQPAELRSLTESVELNSIDPITAHRVRSRQRLNFFFALIVVALGVVLIVFLERRRQDAAEQSAPTEGSAQVAAPAQASEKTQPTPSAKEEPRRRRRPAEARGEGKAAHAEDEGPTTTLLTERYAAVGTAIEQLEAAHGKEGAATYLERYQALAYKDSLTTAEARIAFLHELEELQAEVQAASEQ